MKMQTAVLLILLLLCGARISRGASGEVMPYRGPDGDGTYRTGQMRTDWREKKLRVDWRKDVGYGFSSIVTIGRRALTAGFIDGKSYVFCMSVASGTEAWRREYPDAHGGTRGGGRIGPMATPVLDGKRVYMTTVTGGMVCMELSDGKRRWEYVSNKEGRLYGETGDGVTPVVVGDVLIGEFSQSGTNSAWVAVSKKNGKVKWTHHMSKLRGCDRAYCSPVIRVIDGKPHVLLVSNAGIDCVEAANGKLVWTHPLNDLRMRYGPFCAPVTDGEDRLLLGTWFSVKGTCMLFQIGESGMSRKWNSWTIGKGAFSYVISDGFAYGFGMDGLKCVDLANGKQVWKWASTDKIRRKDTGEIILVGDKLVWLSTSGALYLRDASAAKEAPLVEVQVINACAKNLKKDKAVRNGTISTAPQFSDGRLFCRAPWGEVVSVDVRAKF